jgi:plasmid stability protein
MATLSLIDVPDELVIRLRREARAHRRSLEAEVLARLQASLTPPSRNVGETIAALRRLHAKMAHLPPLDDRWLSRAKAAGRR